MIKEFQAFFTLFKQGKSLANSATWKNHQIAANALVAVLSAAVVIGKGFGYDFHITEESVSQIGVGIAAIYGVFNSVLTVITSDKVGVKKQ